MPQFAVADPQSHPASAEQIRIKLRLSVDLDLLVEFHRLHGLAREAREYASITLQIVLKTADQRLLGLQVPQQHLHRCY